MKWILLLIIPALIYAFERKQEQFRTDPSYFVLPAPFQIPGIGNGWILFGGINNIAFDYMDLYAYGFAGDLKGDGVGLDELYIIPKVFSINGGVRSVRSASILTFDKRGMESGKNEYTYFNGSSIRQSSAGAELTLWNKRINFYWDYYTSDYKSKKFLNSDEAEVTAFDNQQRVGIKSISSSMLLDFTNDFQDPTMGLRISLSHLRPQKDNDYSDSRYSVINQAYNLYLPIGKWSTLALHYSKSDAYMEKTGTTDTAAIRQQLQLKDCSTYTDTQIQEKCNQTQSYFVERTRLQNMYGSASFLGGMDRLRGYPAGRFIGSHTKFYGAEFRWNLDSSVVPFDIFLIKDTRSAFQIAFFYEQGATGDDEVAMMEHMRNSKGIGARVVAKSGYVFRLDYGMSDEGSEVTLLGSYPW